MVDSGPAEFGPRNEYGVLTTKDLAYLLIWAVEGGLEAPLPVTLQLRNIIRKIAPLLPPEDKLMLADLMGNKWEALAKDLST